MRWLTKNRIGGSSNIWLAPFAEPSQAGVHPGGRSCMTGRNVFVDANIFAYVKQADEPVKQAIAAENIRRLASDGRICTSMQVVNECYRVLTRKLRPPLQRDIAWSYVS